MDTKTVEALVKRGWEILPKKMREAFIADKTVVKNQFEMSIDVEGVKVMFRATQSGVMGHVLMEGSVPVSLPDMPDAPPLDEQ